MYQFMDESNVVNSFAIVNPKPEINFYYTETILLKMNNTSFLRHGIASNLFQWDKENQII